MMNKSIFSVFGAIALSSVAVPAVAQIYQQPPGYSVQQPYRGQANAPDFDALDDDDAPLSQNPAALPPPGPAPAPLGPILSPDDPRYGRPSANAAPAGPVLSPNDPRYGQPSGPPPVIYSDRPAQQPRDGVMRPPEGVAGVTGSLQPPQASDPRQSVMALPADEQPETGPVKELPPHLRKQEVAFQTKEPAGTIVVDTSNTYLYYVLGNGRAIRYGIRVGRDGFTWNGVQKITRKAEWPDWHPPAEMIERQPYLPRFMAGGEGNPLGARAMYLGNTVYRIHGTNQPSTIGQSVSSGCFGMLNSDVADLFERVKVGTRVVVLPGGKPPVPANTAAADPVQLQGSQIYAPQSSGSAPIPPGDLASNAPVPGTGPTVVPPLPAPVTVR
jgi:lipoprotein-anchoring transpeptidase ErfK/SrfK